MASATTTTSEIPVVRVERVADEESVERNRQLVAAGLTDTGRERDHNEDTLALEDELGLYIVCDGMGGHQSGEVASAMTRETIVEQLLRQHAKLGMACDDPNAASAWFQQRQLEAAIDEASLKVRDAGASQRHLSGMGTTVVCTKFTAEEVIVAHVGDSRAYRYRAATGLERITRDHSLLNKYIDLGELPADINPADFALSNVIVRAIGAEDARPTVSTIPRRPGDLFLLCSDGLTDMVEEAEIAGILARHSGDLDEAVRRLIDRANASGGHDNITALLVRVDDELLDGGLASEDTDPSGVAAMPASPDQTYGEVDWISLDEALEASVDWDED